MPVPEPRSSAQVLAWSYPALPASIPLARRTVRMAAASSGASEEELDGVALATSEAVTNVVRHAYDEVRGEVHVGICVGPQKLTVVIADDGHGLREGSPQQGLGLGLALMADASHELDLTPRAHGGLEARMIFRPSLGESWAPT